jgi:hypothetical protein
VDATIAAALISGGVGALGIVGTVITSVVGSRNAREATRTTVDAGTETNRKTLEADRESRLWERRAAAYEEMLSVILQREHVRGYDLVVARIETDSDLEKFLDEVKLPSTFKAEGRLVAYASAPVLAAYGVADRSHRESVVSAVQLNTIRKADDSGPALGEVRRTPSRAEEISKSQLDQALANANHADQALTDVIRAELSARPEAAMPPDEVPAKRPGRRYRRRAVEG